MERYMSQRLPVQHCAGLHPSSEVKHVEPDFVYRPKDLWLARCMPVAMQHNTHTSVAVRHISSSVFDM